MRLDADGILVLCESAGMAEAENEGAEQQQNDPLRCVRHAHEDH